jgi:tyrosyl-tRNA synthetase
VLSVEEQLARIRRGVEQIVPEEELVEKLKRSFQTGKPLRVIIGDYTALVGDPSGRDEARQRLTEEQVEANARDYLVQVGKVIDIDRAEVRRNGEWFSKFRFLDVLALTSKITMQRMLERDDFTKRRESGTPIYLHECLYPLMQGHDSVEVCADVELGGSEQLFSLMVARNLQKDAGQEPQVCVTLPILRGLDGERRMGKSLGNYIGVGATADDQFAKTMKIPDELMAEWFTLLTDRPEEEIARLTDPGQTHPMEAKKALGRDIAAFYHGEEAARAAQAEWEKIHSQGQDPTEIPEVAVPLGELQEGQIQAFKLLRLLNLASSSGDARRLVQGGAMTIGPDREKVSDPHAAVRVVPGLIVRVGNRRVVRVKLA